MRITRTAAAAIVVVAAAGYGANALGSENRHGEQVRWAQCLRGHGVPGFPDPNRSGAFDSSRFDDSSPAFIAAAKACLPQQPHGAVAAVPGRG